MKRCKCGECQPCLKAEIARLEKKLQKLVDTEPKTPTQTIIVKQHWRTPTKANPHEAVSPELLIKRLVDEEIRRIPMFRALKKAKRAKRRAA